MRVLDEWWSYLPAGSIDDQVTDLGITYTQSAWLLALLTIGGLIGSPIAALADHGHRRALAMSGAAAIAAGLTAFALGAPFAVLAVAAAVLGGASDVMIRPLESTLTDLDAQGDHRLDRLLGRQHVLTWMGDFIAPALLALGAATVIGWRGVFALTAVVFVGYVGVLATVRWPALRPRPDDGESLLAASGRLVRTRELWLLTVAETIMLPLDEAFLGFAVARAAADGSGASAQLLAGGLVAGGIAGAAIVARRGLDRLLVRIGAALVVLGAAATVAPSGLLAQAVSLALVGGGTAVLWAKVHHRSLTMAPGRSATVPTLVSMLSTPAFLIVVLMGAVADRTSITAALLMAALLTVPLAVVVMLLGGGAVSPDELDELD